MPIEIRELVIKTRVEEPVSTTRQTAGAASGNGMDQSLSTQQMETIIAQVIERVMDALKQQNER